MGIFFKKLEYRFLIEGTKIENANLHTKYMGVSQRIELSLTTLFFGKFCFSLRTSLVSPGILFESAFSL